MDCGDMHDDSLGSSAGKNCSAYLTHAGQHEVNSGSFSPRPIRPSSSPVSSTTVRSAPNAVS